MDRILGSDWSRRMREVVRAKEGRGEFGFPRGAREVNRRGGITGRKHRALSAANCHRHYVWVYRLATFSFPKDAHRGSTIIIARRGGYVRGRTFKDPQMR